ncbi:outer membrane protein assembly factor BamD [Flexibacterium corallicola]|uniref:outer membrane protein assembly factor BamD n=1 Tax=Flexibacterium corallicola TaxID=3037259 RepID=UPI0038621AFA
MLFGTVRGAKPSLRLSNIVKTFALVSLIAVAGCASKDQTSDLDFEEAPAELLYNQGLALRAEGNLKEAERKFSELDRVYPYSEYARKSLINIAYLNYTMRRYPETVSAAKRFVSLYPGHEDSAYALFLIGQSYFAQIPDIGRDQKAAAQAMGAMQEVIQRYPDSEYATEARKKIRIAQDQLAGKEMEVGRYYLKRKNYLASINRFKVVVTNYQTTRHVEEALFRLTESYYALGVINEAQTAAAVLGHNFPQSQWYRDSYSLLQKGGYEPEENKRSWISKAFGAIAGS